MLQQISEIIDPFFYKKASAMVKTLFFCNFSSIGLINVYADGYSNEAVVNKYEVCRSYCGTEEMGNSLFCSRNSMENLKIRHFPETVWTGENFQIVTDFTLTNETNKEITRTNTNYGWDTVEEAKGFQNSQPNYTSQIFEISAPDIAGVYKLGFDNSKRLCLKTVENFELVEKNWAVLKVETTNEDISPQIQQATATFSKKVAARFSEFEKIIDNHEVSAFYQKTKNGLKVYLPEEKTPDGMLTIFDLYGRVIKEIVIDSEPTVSWDGTNSRGIPTPSGVYYFKLQIGKYETSHKLWHF